VAADGDADVFGLAGLPEPRPNPFDDVLALFFGAVPVHDFGVRTGAQRSVAFEGVDALVHVVNLKTLEDGDGPVLDLFGRAVVDLETSRSPTSNMNAATRE